MNEELIRNKSTLTELRELIKNHQKLKDALQDSMVAPMIVLNQRTQAFILIDERFTVRTAAADQDIEEFFKHNLFIDPQVDRNQLRRLI